MRLRIVEVPTGAYLLVVDRIDNAQMVAELRERSGDIKDWIDDCAGVLFFSPEVEIEE